MNVTRNYFLLLLTNFLDFFLFSGRRKKLVRLLTKGEDLIGNICYNGVDKKIDIKFTKAKLFQERFSNVFHHKFYLPEVKYTGSKWPGSTFQASFMHLRHENSLLSIPGSFLTCILL